MSKLIIGMTGTFGSGCSKISKEFIEPLGYSYISLSDILRGKLEETRGVSNLPRNELQDFGDYIRQTEGSDFLSLKAIEIINSNTDIEKWVIDSIRNPNESEAFRRLYPNFFLIGVFADNEIRWNRKRAYYNDDKRAFEEDERRDREESEAYGQRVEECFLNADLVIANNDEIISKNEAFRDMNTKIKEYISLIENPYSRRPSEEEAIMAIAYANGQRSSCLKRKVGAVIVGDFGNIFSAGFNEVPVYDRTCNDKYGGCYRGYVKDEYYKRLANIGISAEVIQTLKSDPSASQKLLDHCRSLHAEENAILNVAISGGALALNGATLYTTT